MMRCNIVILARDLPLRMGRDEMYLVGNVTRAIRSW